MKILFTLTKAFNPNSGGVQRTTWKLGHFFSVQGHEVHYFSLSKDGHIQPQRGTLQVVTEPGREKNSKNLEALVTFIDKIRPEVVINQMPYEVELTNILEKKRECLQYFLVGCLRNSLFSVKNNLSEKLQEALPAPFPVLLNNPLGLKLALLAHRIKHRWQLKRILAAHDKYVLLTPPNREELAYFVGDYKNEKVDCLPNSIPAVFPDSLQQKEKIILHVGRLNTAQKRSDLLLKAWEKLADQLPDWRMIVVGDGPYYQEMSKIIAEKQIPRISLEGYQKPEPYYQRAGIFLMTSAYEGFPNVILEAQSYGCVPVAYDSYPALSWIVNDQEDARLVPAYDGEEMTSRVVALASNVEQLKVMQQNALNNARQFTIEEVGQQWLRFFERNGININL